MDCLKIVNKNIKIYFNLCSTQVNIELKNYLKIEQTFFFQSQKNQKKFSLK